jgi:hypothetical protein
MLDKDIFSFFINHVQLKYVFGLVKDKK